VIWGPPYPIIFSLASIFDLRFLNRKPCIFEGSSAPATLKGNDVINDVSSVLSGSQSAS
jgi:hypothetical protein